MSDKHQEPIAPIRLYECLWCSGGASGTVHVWSTDADTAMRAVQEHASCFGLPHEHPMVGRAEALQLIEPGVELPADIGEITGLLETARSYWDEVDRQNGWKP